MLSRSRAADPDVDEDDRAWMSIEGALSLTSRTRTITSACDDSDAPPPSSTMTSFPVRFKCDRQH